MYLIYLWTFTHILEPREIVRVWFECPYAFAKPCVERIMC